MKSWSWTKSCDEVPNFYYLFTHARKHAYMNHGTRVPIYCNTHKVEVEIVLTVSLTLIFLIRYHILFCMFLFYTVEIIKIYYNALLIQNTYLLYTPIYMSTKSNIFERFVDYDLAILIYFNFKFSYII